MQALADAVALSTPTVDDEKAVAIGTVGKGCKRHTPGRSFPEGFRARPSEERMDDVRRTAEEELLLLLPLLSPGGGGIISIMVGETVVEVAPEEGTCTAIGSGDCVLEDEDGV